MPVAKAAKTQYSEAEAAEELGISVEKLRRLVKKHIVDSDDDISNLSIASFQPSDLLLLRMLAMQEPEPPVGV